MFSLMYGFWQCMARKTEYYILILGLDRAGKTTLLEQMKAIFKDVQPLPPDQIMPTVGLNIGRLEVGNVKLIFWDLGGQSELRSIWDKYFRETHGLVFVVDSADPDRFNEAKNELEILVRTSELRGVPFLFFVNKQDIENASTPRQMEEVFNMKQIQSTRPTHVQPLTAINGEGVRDGVMWLVETLKKCARKTEADL
eukprot:Phypoly_transcript_07480.p1 GENE.Phypoly_transcript_07480~~Phypoly_transcript_07480.p1  ORF type:complete len:197 (-),score=31.33 Phypoly_transcript_07480:774-1364(-)